MNKRIAVTAALLVVAAGVAFMIYWLLRPTTRFAFIVQLSADKRELYYCRDRTSRELMTYNLQSGEKRLIATTSTLVFPWQRLPAEDEWIGVVYSQDGRGQIHELSSTLAPRRRLIESAVSDDLPCLGPRGRTIVFVRAERNSENMWKGPRWTDMDVYSCGIDGANPKRLTNMQAPDISRPSIDSGENTVIFSLRHRYQKRDIFSIRIGSLQPDQLLPSGPTNSEPVFSTDSKRIAFVSDRTQNYQYEVWTMDRRGGNLTQVTKIRRQCSGPIFLPGDKALAFIMDERELWRINVDGTGLQRLD